MHIVRIIKDWDWPDLIRQTPGGSGVWGKLKFMLEPIEECDFVIVLNNRLKKSSRVMCPPEHVWAIMQEPYYPGLTDWMLEKHEIYSKVFTHHRSEYDDAKYIPSHPAIPWHVNRTYNELVNARVPEKSKTLSWIVGDAMDLPGHVKRWSFLEYIKKDPNLELDLYGKKIRYIEDKWDALAPYRYALAVENTSGLDYWTEKVADCFLTWTVPLYWGCVNLEDYFPSESFIRIDIEKPKESVEKIKKTLKEDKWENRVPALTEARELVLNKYQLFPHITELIDKYSLPSVERKSVIIPAYRRSAKAFFNRRIYKLKKRFGKLQRIVHTSIII